MSAVDDAGAPKAARTFAGILGAPDLLVSPLTATLLALVAVFAFSALMVLLAYAPDLRSGNDGGAHALSKSAVGFAGAAEALRLSGAPVVILRAPVPSGRHSGLLILTPTPTTAWAGVDAVKFAGPVLIVLPKWEAIPDLTHTGWIGKASLIDIETLPPNSLMRTLGVARAAGVATPVLRASRRPFAAGAALRPGPIPSLQSLHAPGWVPVMTDASGAVVLARAANRTVWILSDPDLLNTQGLKSVDTFAAGLALLQTLRRGDGPYIFDVSLVGLGRARSVLRLLFDPPFLGCTLCLAVAGLLAAVRRRFGPIDRGGRAIPMGDSSLIDNTAALIRLAGREYRMAGRYADLTVDLAGRSVGAPRDLGGEALVAFLDRLGARRGLAEPISELAVQARMSRTAERALSVARRLHVWRLDLAWRERPAAANLDLEPRSGLRPPEGKPKGAAP